MPLKDTKIGSVIDSHGIVRAAVYRRPDGSVDAGEIGDGRTVDELQQTLRVGLSFRPCKAALQEQRNLSRN